MRVASTIAPSIVVEKQLPHPPEKVWRALTQPHLIEEWMAAIDFKPVVGHRFSLRIDPQPDRSFAFDCVVTEVTPNRRLSYSWDSAGDGEGGLKSRVIWTLTPTPMGTHLRMEQSGFAPGQTHFYHGARMGWPQFLAMLSVVLDRLE